MPELAEVERSRRVWDRGVGQLVRAVEVPNPKVRVFRGTDLSRLQSALAGTTLIASEARGKQLLFRFGPSVDCWLGIHLGMAGRLRVEPTRFEVRKHDFLILRQAEQSLVFSDQRHFGRVLFHEGADEPGWWSRLPPSILSRKFTRTATAEFLNRRKGAPLKAVLLMQERFPGVGNWMADEILWRARLDPRRRPSSLGPGEVAVLYRMIRRVCRLAIEAMDENWDYPDSWLFAHRWQRDGRCPRCARALSRAEVGGRTTVWCQRCQP